METTDRYGYGWINKKIHGLDFNASNCLLVNLDEDIIEIHYPFNFSGNLKFFKINTWKARENAL